MAKLVPPHLIAVEVKNLLGQFNHAIKFSADDEFVIIHGPNGIGKTKLLELISNAFVPNVPALLAIPFDSAQFVFSDDSFLTIERQQQSAPSEDEDDGPTLNFTLRRPDQAIQVWTSRSHTGPVPSYHATELDRYVRRMGLPLRRIGQYRWQDTLTGELLRIEDLEYKYPFALPPVLTGRREPKPELMERFFDSLHVHLIETQRLIFPRKWRHNRAQGIEEGEPQSATVLEFSEDLKRRFGNALADNSRTSQQLDRRFPGRLLTAGSAPADATEENIRDRYIAQGEIRKKLTEISLLDTSYELPLPERKLEDWERLVLCTYLDDTDKKLTTFAPLLERVELMREIVNSRFLNKSLVIDRERGFRFKVTDSHEVGPDQLSSGEQHELVLIYDLLFNTSPNSLVLIDEPEISLHVSWQQEFLSDLVQISKVTSLRFVIATHSPQIINEWWSRTASLAP
jgi:ABC-type lipoprotein export system ATPase subunit